MNRRKTTVVAFARPFSVLGLGILLGVYMPLWAMFLTVSLIGVFVYTTAYLERRKGGEHA